MDEPLYEVVEYMALYDLDLVAVVSDDEQQVLGASRGATCSSTSQKYDEMMIIIICGRDCVLPC